MLFKQKQTNCWNVLFTYIDTHGIRYDADICTHKGDEVETVREYNSIYTRKAIHISCIFSTFSSIFSNNNLQFRRFFLWQIITLNFIKLFGQSFWQFWQIIKVNSIELFCLRIFFTIPKADTIVVRS